MAYAIQFLDKPDSAALRASVRPAHIEYLDAHKPLILAGGALLDDDGTGGHGGIILLDTDDRAVAESFVKDDPYQKAGLFAKVTVTRWRKAFFDGKKLV
jgi:uncharacterized protein